LVVSLAEVSGFGDDGARRAGRDEGHVLPLLPTGNDMESQSLHMNKGTPLSKTRSLLFRFIGARDPGAGPGWWEYFGSFGDDIFGDEDPDDAT
jgi:hypothetical protein